MQFNDTAVCCFYREGRVCFAALTGRGVFVLLLLQGGMCLFCCFYRVGCVCLLLYREGCVYFAAFTGSMVAYFCHEIAIIII